MQSEESSYYYRAFGLTIGSDYRLDELVPSQGPADIYIRAGRVTVEFPGPAEENAYWSEGKSAFAFRVKEVGSFLIRNGLEMIIEESENGNYEALRLFILGTCMGAMLLQRGIIPIHGSAILLENRGVIITGQSGAGKSTLTAALIKRGYPFLADDIAALDVEEGGEVTIMPAFPKQKLWRDTAIQLFGSVDAFERIPGDRDKYHIPMTEQFMTTSSHLFGLIEISVHAKDQVEITELRGSEKLETILSNTFRVEMVEEMGIQIHHFLQCSRIASNISVYKLKRPANGLTVDDQIQAIMNQILDGARPALHN